MDRKESGRNITINIKVWGIVQGVGFRPFVSKLAKSMSMNGKVRNLGGLVEIILSDTEEKINIFIDELQKNKPAPAEIVHIEKTFMKQQTFNDFEIEKSLDSFEGSVMIPSDLAICNDCIKEMYDPKDRRYRHPYNSCMVCGPRYSIIQEIPYDRKNTTMSEFEMCPTCKIEYSKLEDRRFHAQTISCHDCGPYAEFEDSTFNPDNLTYLDNTQESARYEKDIEKQEDIKETEQAKQEFKNSISISHKNTNQLNIDKSIEHINAEGILALKGTGGYYFVCSAFSDKACSDIRKIKFREKKPFAVMFRSIEQIKEYCICSDYEIELLESRARPIVLLEKKLEFDNEVDVTQFTKLPTKSNKNISEKVSTTSRYIGAFLPSMGIQYLLLDETGPLVMTSANISSEPMIIDDENMEGALRVINNRKNRENMKNIPMLSNQRKILVRQDDSVVRVIDNKPQMIRRSKGYAPVPLHINCDNEMLNTQDIRILATGGQLKSAFALTKGNFAYISEFLSDLESCENTDNYLCRLLLLKELLQIEPSMIVCDSHPLYFTTKFAKELLQKQKLEFLMVQHHHAHIASVMAEHDIEGKILGFSFDGTGYGTDGNIWGSEMLMCEKDEFSRLGHLEYVNMIGGDSSIKEGWKSCYSYLIAFGLEEAGHKRDSRFEIVKAALSNNINSIKSSSMGRLFDGVASLMDIHHENSYEGECAIMLENFAAKAIAEDIKPYEMSFEINDENIYSAKTIFQSIIKGNKRRAYKEALALGFHIAVAELITNLAIKVRAADGINQVALSGGVFQNKVLMEATLELLKKDGFEVYYNISVPPNDGGICLGQSYIGLNASKKL